MSGNSDYEKPIPSKRLREALNEASAIPGRAAKDAMFHDLELNGMTFKDGQHTLGEVHSALRKIFGIDDTTLMQRLQKTLER